MKGWPVHGFRLLLLKLRRLLIDDLESTKCDEGGI